jgi:hypothetical protein
VKGKTVMKTLKAITIILLVISSSALIVADASAQDKSNLEVLDIKMEPIRQGRNVVSAKVRNASNEDRAFDIEIGTKSFTGIWQKQFPHVIAGGRTQWIRQAYKIRGPITDGLRIRLRFCTAGPATGVNRQATKHYFKEVVYSADDVEYVAPDESELEPASEYQRRTIAEALLQFQNCIRNKDYEAAWQLFSQDLIDAEMNFQGSMETPYSGFPLSRTEILALEPKSAGRRKGVLALTTALKDERWMVNFVKVADKWRIDSFERIDATPKKKVPLDPAVQEQALRKAFEQWQNSMRDGKHEITWRFLANGLRRSKKIGNDFQRFAKGMDSDENPMKTLFMNLRPESVTSMRMGESAVLNTSHAGQPWKILFVMEDGQWKIRIFKR